MKRYDPTTNTRHQRKAFKALHEALAAHFELRGPYETKNGWPYYLIDTATQTLSVRSTKSNGKRIFIVYEDFGSLSDDQPTYQCDKSNVVQQIDALITKDIDNWPLRSLL